MQEAIVVTSRVRVPGDALSVRATRASGPGGQNVNKVASRVELRVDMTRIAGLTAAERARLRELARPSLARDGRLLVTSQRSREQSMNLGDARQKVRALIARALVAPKRRVKTRPTRASRERRLDSKRRQSERKRSRSWRGDG